MVFINYVTLPESDSLTLQKIALFWAESCNIFHPADRIGRVYVDLLEGKIPIMKDKNPQFGFVIGSRVDRFV